MFFLSMKIFGMMVLDSIMKFVMRMSFVIVMMVTVFVFPSDFLMMTADRSVKVLERMSMMFVMMVIGSFVACVVIGINFVEFMLS